MKSWHQTRKNVGQFYSPPCTSFRRFPGAPAERADFESGPSEWGHGRTRAFRSRPKQWRGRASTEQLCDGRAAMSIAGCGESETSLFQLLEMHKFELAGRNHKCGGPTS